MVGSACPLDMILEAVEVRMLGRGGGVAGRVGVGNEWADPAGL